MQLADPTGAILAPANPLEAARNIEQSRQSKARSVGIVRERPPIHLHGSAQNTTPFGP